MKSRHACHGAVVVEAAMIFMLFLALLGAVVYFCIRFYKYHVMEDAIQAALRQVVVDADKDWGQLENEVQVRAQQILMDNYGIGPSQVTVTRGTACHLAVVNRCALSVQASWADPCLICPLVGLPASVGAMSKLIIEDPCFEGRADGCPNLRDLGVECD